MNENKQWNQINCISFTITKEQAIAGSDVVRFVIVLALKMKNIA
jgi:hypothetical protein